MRCVVSCCGMCCGVLWGGICCGMVSYNVVVVCDVLWWRVLCCVAVWCGMM